ncbi:MAG: glycosyltransferase family 4 protein [Gemmatimonadaceae bacterium]
MSSDLGPSQAAPHQTGRRWIIVAESAAASAGVPKRVRHDAITLLRAGERVAVVASDAAKLVELLAPHVDASQLARLQVEEVDRTRLGMTVPERIALRAARLTKSATRYEDVDYICYTRALARGAAAALRRIGIDAARDALIANGSEFVHAVRLACPDRAPPVLYVIHSMINERAASGANPYGPLSTAFLFRYERAALRAAHCVMPVADAMARAARELEPRMRAVKVIYNSIDEPAPNDRPSAERDVDVLFVGRLSPEKGIDTLLAAAGQLPEGVRLTIVGHGVLEAQVRAAAASAPERIEFLGRRSQPEVLALWRRARVAVLPSYSDPFPFTVLEALSQGTPVVGSAVSGIPEMVTDGENGLLVAPGDARALASAVTRLLTDEPLRCRLSAGAATSASRFSLDAAAPTVLAAYRESVNGWRTLP